MNAMVWLAGEGYFDSTPCHRLTTEGIKVLQCGDPTGFGQRWTGLRPARREPAEQDG